jgi:mannose-6-phosphate isomerase-like protein (cupin superfamily)
MSQQIAKRNFKDISVRVSEAYNNTILEVINDHCLRMSVMEEAYKWHYHENTDELFIILEGELKIEIKDSETVSLKPGEFIKIPARTIHKTSAMGRTVNLCFERNAEDTVFLE